MKIKIFLFCLLFSSQAFSNCQPIVEEKIIQEISSQKIWDHRGKIATGTVFVTVGGFYGTMGVILLGPLWAGAIVGASFGTMAAVPVGTTFVIVHQVKKKNIQNMGQLLSVISHGDEFTKIHKELLKKIPDLTLEELEIEIDDLNATLSLCDGTIAKYKRMLPVRRKMAKVDEIVRFLADRLSSAHVRHTELIN